MPVAMASAVDAKPKVASRTVRRTVELLIWVIPALDFPNRDLHLIRYVVIKSNHEVRKNNQ
jgi:hypothetical protein